MNLETPAGRKHKTCNSECNQTQNLEQVLVSLVLHLRAMTVASGGVAKYCYALL